MFHYIHIVSLLGIACSQIKALTLMHKQVCNYKIDGCYLFHLECGEDIYRA